MNDLETVRLALDNDVLSLNTNLNEVRYNHFALETRLKQNISVLEKQHLKDQDTYNIIKDRYEYMVGHSSEMNDKIVNMTESKKLMVKNIEKTNSEIAVLK